MSRCKFTTIYYDYEIRNLVDFNCQELPLVSGRCIFHDKDYLQDKTDNEEHKRAVLNRLKRKLNHAISNNEPLLCLGFQLPEFSLSDLSVSKEFTKPVSFSGAKFQGKVDFSGANFHEANFSNSEFYRKTYFSGDFNGKTKFNYVLFEGKEKINFDIENLSNVSMNTDLTGFRFSDKARWGESAKEDSRFEIIDERLLEDKINKENDGHTTKDFNLGSIKAVYRNLRELRI